LNLMQQLVVRDHGADAWDDLTPHFALTPMAA
jgi:hypothetical protein